MEKLIRKMDDGVVIELTDSQRRAFLVVAASCRQADSESGARNFSIGRETRVRKSSVQGEHVFVVNATAYQSLFAKRLVTGLTGHLTPRGRLLADKCGDDVDGVTAEPIPEEFR